MGILALLTMVGCQDTKMSKTERIKYVKRVLASLDSEDNYFAVQDDYEKYSKELEELQASK